MKKPDIPVTPPDFLKEEILKSTKASCLAPYVPQTVPETEKKTVLERNEQPLLPGKKYQDKLIKIEVKDGKRITTSLTHTGSYISTYETLGPDAPDGVLYDIKEEAQKKAQKQKDKDKLIEDLSKLGLLTRREELIFSGIFHKRNMLVLMQMFGKAGYACRCYPIRSSNNLAKDYFCVVVYRTPTALHHFEKKDSGAVSLFRVFKTFKDVVEGEETYDDADARQSVER